MSDNKNWVMLFFIILEICDTLAFKLVKHNVSFGRSRQSSLHQLSLS